MDLYHQTTVNNLYIHHHYFQPSRESGRAHILLGPSRSVTRARRRSDCRLHCFHPREAESYPTDSSTASPPARNASAALNTTIKPSNSRCTSTSNTCCHLKDSFSSRNDLPKNHSENKRRRIVAKNVLSFNVFAGPCKSPF